MAAEEQKVVKSNWLDDCEKCEHLLFICDDSQAMTEMQLRCPFKTDIDESCQWCRKPPFTNRYMWCDKREKYVRFRWRRLYPRQKLLPEPTENSSGSETDGYEESDGDTKDYEEWRSDIYGGAFRWFNPSIHWTLDRIINQAEPNPWWRLQTFHHPTPLPCPRNVSHCYSHLFCNIFNSEMSTHTRFVFKVILSHGKEKYEVKASKICDD